MRASFLHFFFAEIVEFSFILFIASWNNKKKCARKHYGPVLFYCPV